jgi:hypothetical protein
MSADLRLSAQAALQRCRSGAEPGREYRTSRSRSTTRKTAATSAWCGLGTLPWLQRLAAGEPSVPGASGGPRRGVRVGLFGASGVADFDDIRLEAVDSADKNSAERKRRERISRVKACVPGLGVQFRARRAIVGSSLHSSSELDRRPELLRSCRICETKIQASILSNCRSLPVIL